MNKKLIVTLILITSLIVGCSNYISVSNETKDFSENITVIVTPAVFPPARASTSDTS